jgi:hypothetical protein
MGLSCERPPASQSACSWLPPRSNVPRPRNFRCAVTINDVPDGQLFWIIRFGSPGTSMPPHRKFTDEQIWELVSYLRTLAM